jgi:hypothetical protein
MRLRALLPGAAALLLLAGPAPAQVKEVTELLPAQTLAYVELRHPDRISREGAALLKGSYLDDMPTRMAKYREQRGDNDRFFFDDMMVGMFGIFLSPEMIAEAGRIQGGAVALTGFTKEKEPEVVGILLSGESNAPTFFLRMYLSVESQTRKVAEAEGVNIYRERRMIFRGGVPGGQPPPPPELRETGPFFALLPGMVLVGSTADSVKQVIRRTKGRTAEPALSSVAAVKDAARLRERPGLFAYADTGALAAQLDELTREGLAGTPTWVGLIKGLVNPKSVRTAVASLSLESGTTDLRMQLALDPKETSPVLDLLSDRKASPELLHFVPRDALLAVTSALPEGEKRWQKALAMLDTVAKAHGESELSLPSKTIAAVEEKLKVRFGKDVAGRITGFAYALDPRDEIPAGATQLGMLVLSAANAEDAQFLEEFVPKLVGLFGRDEPAAPTRETIQGQRISSLPGGGLPWGTAVHYGRQGNTLVIGQDRKTVAAALSGGAKKEGWLGEPRAAGAVKGLEEPVLIGPVSPAQALVEAFKLTGMVRAGPRFAPAGGPPVAPPGGAPNPGPNPLDKYIKELLKAAEPLPPLVVGLERKAGSATLTVRQSGLRGPTARIFDTWLDSMLDQMLQNRAGGPGAGFGGVKGVAPPPPPPKP